MHKGIIMEVQSRHWIVLTPEGDFIKVPRTNPSLLVGEEITFQATKRNRRRLVPAFVSVAAAAVLGMFFVLPQLAPDRVDAQTYIYVDVNPSVEIGIDEERNIVELHPLNKAAKQLLDGEEWKKESLNQFVIDFLGKAKQHGYVQQKDQVVLSGYKEEKNSEETLDHLKTILDNKSKQENLQLEVRSLVVPKKVKSKANQFGLSPVKYAAWLIAKKEGKQLEAKEMEETPLTELALEVPPVSEMLNKPEVLPQIVDIIEEEQPKATEPKQEPRTTDEPKPPATTPNNQDEPTQEPQPEPNNEQPEQDHSGTGDTGGTNQPPTDHNTNTDTSQSTDTNTGSMQKTP